MALKNHSVNGQLVNGQLSVSGTISSMSSPTQLFGQPQVAAPQFFLTSNPLQSQTGAAASVPVQQLLIPVSTGILHCLYS